jgi:hypothetical protein
MHQVSQQRRGQSRTWFLENGFFNSAQTNAVNGLSRFTQGAAQFSQKPHVGVDPGNREKSLEAKGKPCPSL